MTTTAIQPHSVDLGALAGAISGDVRERVSETVVRLFDNLDEDDRPLTQVQKVDAVRVVLDSFDGLEIAVADELIRELDRAGVETWGLSANFKKLLSPQAR